MLPGEGKLPPETLSAREGVNVNDIFEFTCALSDHYHRNLFKGYFRRFRIFGLILSRGHAGGPGIGVLSLVPDVGGEFMGDGDFGPGRLRPPGGYFIFLSQLSG